MIRFVVALVVAMFTLSAPTFAERHDAETAYVFAQAKVGELIDINRAKADELMTLKAIGEARAKAIIKGRPYKRKDELVQKKILPESVYDGIKDRIIAKQ
jgi:DNA uptake protein ComE-like DNA-binding protein